MDDGVPGWKDGVDDWPHLMARCERNLEQRAIGNNRRIRDKIRNIRRASARDVGSAIPYAASYTFTLTKYR